MTGEGNSSVEVKNMWNCTCARGGDEPIYMCPTALLTSRRCILNIYSTNILTEYFKHAAHSPFFFSSRCRLFHNSILVPVIFTFYIQGVLNF